MPHLSPMSWLLNLILLWGSIPLLIMIARKSPQNRCQNYLQTFKAPVPPFKAFSWKWL